MQGTPITVADGRTGISSATDGRPELAAAALGQYYSGGEILADDASASGIMFTSGLDLRAFVTVGFHPYFERAMADPAHHVQWIVAYDGDIVSTAIARDPARFAAFHLVLRDGRVRLFTTTAVGDFPGASHP
jgi:hypothetical protein